MLKEINFTEKLNLYLISNNIRVHSQNKIYETQKKDSHWVEKRIGEIINSIRKHDQLIIYNITHLARSSLQVYQILARLQQKNITLHIIDKNLIVKLGELIETKKILYLCEMAEESFILRRTSDAQNRREYAISKNIKNKNLKKLDQKEKAVLDKKQDDIMNYLNFMLPKFHVK